jgi:curved DNA-binding protein CbpA
MQIASYRNPVQEGPAWQQVTISRERKAVTYFASCLEVLGIQEEVALTEDALKKAYKKMAVRSHPDKGGSEEQFEAVTRAYAYLSDILRRIQGGRDKPPGVVEAPTVLEGSRSTEAQAWKHAEPVRLNPQNLDMNAFNRMFEQTHMPDPDNDGYGDWLTSADSGSGSAPKFSGKFNRDVFNRMFDEESHRQGAGVKQTNALITHPDAMALLPTMGVEIGRDRPETYTAAPNQRQQYTDLRAAYTSESTFSSKVANVRVEDRQYESYKAQRASAPTPLSREELAMLQNSEQELKLREDMRQRRAAERGAMEQNYFDRIKQLVITDGAVNLNGGGSGGGGMRGR